jgi:hypothetical protein
MTSVRSSQIPGVEAANRGIANHITSNAKWRTIAGSRPKTRYSAPKPIAGRMSSTNLA